MSALGKRSLGDFESSPGPQSAVKDRRRALDTDEILLENEQLVDKVRTLEDDLLRCKEKAARQLGFLEEENTKVHKTATDVKERYYEEKKNWQRKLREAEAGHSANVISVAASPYPAFSTATGTAPFKCGAETNPNWEHRLSSLQVLSQEKSEQCALLSQDNAELKLKLQQWEPLVAVAQAISCAAEGNDTLLADNRDLRRRCSELELSLRHTNRVNVQYKQDTVNHTLLQSQLAALKADSCVNNDVKKTLMGAQKALEGLTQEKLHWSLLFGDINQKQREILRQVEGTTTTNEFTVGAGAGISGATTDTGTGGFEGGFDMEFGEDSAYGEDLKATPEAVLLAYSKLQQQCAVLLSCSQKANTAASESKRILRSLQQDHHELHTEHAKLQSQFDSSSKNLQNHQLKASLYDVEITSVRGLVSSYESELSMGRPDVAKAFAAQEKLLEEVRGHLDKQRKQLGKILLGETAQERPLGPVCVDTVATAGAAGAVGEALLLSEANTQNQELAAELKAQKEDRAALVEYKYHLECSVGVDFVPSRTKVLHLVSNPYQQSAGPDISASAASAASVATASSSGGSSGGSGDGGMGGLSSIPHIALKAYKLEYASLKRRLSMAGAVSAGAGASVGEDAGARASAADSSMNLTLNSSVMDSAPTSASASLKVPPIKTAPASVSSTAGADSIKLNQRLKEMFRDRIQTFREGVYLLTGWKVDLIYDQDSSGSSGSSSSSSSSSGATNNMKRPKLRMRSMYAEAPDDSLLFHWCGDRLDLLDTDFARRLDPLTLQNLTQYVVSSSVSVSPCLCLCFSLPL